MLNFLHFKQTQVHHTLLFQLFQYNVNFPHLSSVPVLVVKNLIIQIELFQIPIYEKVL
jgi:hypothetical protein